MTDKELKVKANKDLISYLFNCVIFKHQNDYSYRITNRAREKENELFDSAITFIMELDENGEVFVKDKENAELKAQIEKMKCCSNCNNYKMTYLPYWCAENNIPTYPRQKCDKWSMRND